MPEKSIILFDGVCNLCNGLVTFILPRDRHDRFLFGTLQAQQTTERLQGFHLNLGEPPTIILIEDGEVFTRSTAVLRIARNLGGIWSLAYPFIVLPAFIRDSVYNVVARYRYRIFGKKATCMVPRPEWKAKFID